MTRDEVITNIGTIAKSGTRQFLESLTGDQKTDAKMMASLASVSYSAFVVADKVIMRTRRAGDAADTGSHGNPTALVGIRSNR